MNSRDDDRETEADAVIAALADAIRPAMICDDRRARMLARVESLVAAPLPQGMTTLRRSEGEWLSINPRVQIKVLRVDAEAGNQTLLIRAARGAVLPRHRHSRDEEFIVLEGQCRIGALVLDAGDAHFAAAGTWHDDITTESGVLALVRGEYPAPAYA
jgi:quercetin dioxygenase-like cupin family protein